jgi:hypothetical protein
LESSVGPIPEDRELTPEEFRLAKWMLEHGCPAASEFLPQLRQCRVVSRCRCGCASVDFAVDGLPTPSGALRILGDFIFGSEAELGGIFIFECGGVLAGIEVWSPLGDDALKSLPTSQALRPVERTR